MATVAIIDYGMCNLDSVSRAIQECGARPVITSAREEIAKASHVILPGVGSFHEAMDRVRDQRLDKALVEDVVRCEVPLLGICLGMQLLASMGTEGDPTEGLGIIDGDVVRLVPTDEDPRIPHIGWNEVRPIANHPLFRGIEPGRDFYFVHSYVFRPRNEENITGSTEYAGGFCSVVSSGLTHGVQFHPEKSSKAGFQLLRNFLSL